MIQPHIIDIIKVDEVAEISYALVNNPLFTSNYIETELKASDSYTCIYSVDIIVLSML